MQELFDYFEEAEELVYISDMDTDELLFMDRKLRESLGYTDASAYQGKKCYEVMQNREHPCPFCNNDRLRCGGSETWAHDDPALGQRLIIRDRMFVSNGRRYRIEAASQESASVMEDSVRSSTLRGSILNECIQLLFDSSDPCASIDSLLEYLGKRFHTRRAYIFKIHDDGTASNTYEWCAEGVKPKKGILQKLPLSDIQYWMDTFAQGRTVEIFDIEDIRDRYPAAYSLLKPQRVHSLVAGPIHDGAELKGFIGLDDPDRDDIAFLAKILQSLDSYMMPQLKRCALYRRFEQMSYYDPLTGAYNYNAMLEHHKRSGEWKTFGAVYCDVNGLKETNDTRGHDAGDALLRECYHVLESTLQTGAIYRLGGDEFVAVYHDIDEKKVERDVEALHLAVMQSDCQIAVGWAWSDELPVDTEEIIRRADKMMYQEKLLYYEEASKSYSGAMTAPGTCTSLEKSEQDLQARLQRFLSNTYCDIAFLLTLLSKDNDTTYFFFGDMQKDLYYISDNMRKKFGFQSNVVPDLINVWAGRIHDPGLLKRFWNDINGVMEKKQRCHDLRYQIADAEGNNIWIRCYGKVKWNEDGTKPMFFAGRITQQDADFVVDSLTNFPTETVLVRHLRDIQERGLSCQAIGIALNNISQINNNHGRSYGDELVWEISARLYEKFSDKLAFYRLSGMRCVALADLKSKAEIEDTIRQVKEIIEDCYRQMGITLQNPCSFALLHYPQKDISPEDFIENTVSLIKVAQSDPTYLYADDSNNEIRQIQDMSNMELQLIQDVMNGMENFRIVIQPVVSTKDGRPVGGETLLRWTFHDKRISPGVFIPILERENVIHLVGRWTFERAVSTCSRLLSYYPELYLAVNVSLQQLNDSGFIQFIQDTLKQYDLEGKHIVVEMTESCMDEQPEKLTRFVEACESMGIRIALDDFGSGYSSLRVLLQYPSSIIKLDRSLLLEMSDSEEKKNFISSIVYACHQFGKKVCMEGVESEFQDAIVKESACDMIQGFYYYRPMEVDQVYRILAEKYGDAEDTTDSRDR